MSDQSQYYFIQIWLPSLEKPLTFPLAEAAWGRFKRSFSEGKEGFFVFATRDGRTLALDLKSVQLARIWIAEEEGPMHDNAGSKVTLYLASGAEETFEAKNPVDLAGIFTKLKVGAEGEVLSFTDPTGKQVYFAVGGLTLLEATTDFVEEGYKQIYFRERGKLPPK